MSNQDFMKEIREAQVMPMMMGMSRLDTPDTTYLPGMKTVWADQTQRDVVNYVKDVVYADRNGHLLTMQMLYPYGLNPAMMTPFGFRTPDPERKLPVVIFVQGSAWMEQDTYVGLPKLVDIAKDGYIVASVKYRASMEAGWPAFLTDVKSAIRFLRANADLYGVDTEHIAIWGDSSGGHTALLVGLTADMEEFKTEDNHEYSDGVNAVVDFYGPTDVTHINDVPRDPAFTADPSMIPEDILYGGCVIDHPEISQPGNPLNYVTAEKKIPPVMIAHGDGDPMVPFNQSVLIAKKLQECGKFVDFYKVCGAGHGTYLWTREMLDNVRAFLKAYL